jgi:hypothetical protein
MKVDEGGSNATIIHHQDARDTKFFNRRFREKLNRPIGTKQFRLFQNGLYGLFLLVWRIPATSTL